MLDTQGNVKELDQGALRIAATGILPVLLSTASIFEDDTVREARPRHIFASG